MPSFTANIAFLFEDRPFLDRIAAAKAAGFDQVECHFPYEFTREELRARLDDHGVRMTGLNTAPGSRASDWGLAGLPGRESEFRHGFEQALSYADALGSSVIHVMAGIVDQENPSRCRDTYVSNLQWASGLAMSLPIKLVLEPLNSRDKPGYLVSKSDEIVKILADIGRDNVGLLFDFYHIQIMEGDLLRRLERHWNWIGHMQIAAVPSRAEPDEGEIDYRSILDAIDARGWRGLVGLEYKPRGQTEVGLAWMRKLGVQ